MIEEDELHEFCKTMRETEKAMRVSIEVPHDVVTRLVISEMMVRYKHPRNSGSKDLIRQVLTKFYLTDDEFQQLAEIPTEENP